MSKYSGAYYTPKSLADYISQRSLTCFSDQTIDVIEPSCGDGIFLQALNQKILQHPTLSINIDAVELEKTALDKVNELSLNNFNNLNTFNEDYISFCNASNRKKYDLVIGNCSPSKPMRPFKVFA